MKIAFLGSPLEYLYPREGTSLAIQSVGLGGVWVPDHEVHVVTKTHADAHGWLAHTKRGHESTVDKIHYHCLPADKERDKQIKASGGPIQASLQEGFGAGYLKKALAVLRKLTPDVVIVWNASPFLAPLKEALPSSKLCLWETRGWHLHVDAARGRSLLEPADFFLSGSEFLGQSLKEHLGESAASITIPLGVDTDLFRAFVPRGRLPRKRDLTGGQANLLVYIGNMTPEKGPHRLLENFATIQEKIKAPHLFLIGPPVGDPTLPTQTDPWAQRRGGYAEEIRQGATNSGDNVHLLMENLAQPKVADILSAADLLFVPDEQARMTSQPIVEAMASGVPTVATDLGANRELVTDETVGVLIPRGDDEALCERAREILESTPDERHERGLKARETVTTHRAFESVGNKLIALFQS